jgi:hypothetical protein
MALAVFSMGYMLVNYCRKILVKFAGKRKQVELLNCFFKVVISIIYKIYRVIYLMVMVLVMDLGWSPITWIAGNRWFGVVNNQKVRFKKKKKNKFARHGTSYPLPPLPWRGRVPYS